MTDTPSGALSDRDVVWCAVGNLALAGIVLLARGWPVSIADAALIALAASPWAVQAVRRRRQPVLAYVVPVLVAQPLLALDAQHGDPSALLLLGMVATVALSGRVLATALVTATANVVVLALDVATPADGALLWTVGLWLSCAAGLAYQREERALAELGEAQERLAERATLEERRRVAREVHDVVAHTLAVTMLHLTGARLALSEGERTEAEAGLREAERLGRESLIGLRRTVGLLTQDESAVAVPAPGLRELWALVEEYAAAGMAVTVRSSVDPADVPESHGLTAYRIVQESLANAARHAPGARVAVVVDVRDGALTLEVADDGSAGPLGEPAHAGGQGVPGMRERARLLGGTCDAGPCPDGTGWQVRAVLPVRAPARGGCHAVQAISGLLTEDGVPPATPRVAG